MISKTQKIWLWIFGAMFIIPEILWSPILNFYYEFYQSSFTSFIHPLRNNFLQNSDNSNYLKFILFLQFLGISLFFIFLLKNKSNVKLIWRHLGLILLFSILILTGFALYFALFFNIAIF